MEILDYYMTNKNPCKPKVMTGESFHVFIIPDARNVVLAQFQKHVTAFINLAPYRHPIKQNHYEIVFAFDKPSPASREAP